MVSFPNAPRGTSEEIIYRSMADLQDEGMVSDESDRKSKDDTLLWTETDIEVARKIEENSSHPRSESVDSGRSDSTPGSGSSSGKSSPTGIRHSGGVAVTFGITASDTVIPVDNLSGWQITQNKFHPQHVPMYVCYPADEGFGLDGVKKLIKCLRQ